MPVLIFVFWIALNGRLAWDVLVIGIAVSALVSVFTYRFLGVSIKTSQKNVEQNRLDHRLPVHVAH